MTLCQPQSYGRILIMEGFTLMCTSRKQSIIIIVGLYCLCLPSFAASPWSIYQKSRHQDPSYQQAIHQHAYIEKNTSIAKSAMLPQISAAYSYSKTLNRSPLDSRYTTELKSITAQQALFNIPAYYNYLQTKELHKASLANFKQAQQDLILRTLTAYLEVLEAHDIYAATLSEQNELKERLKETSARAKIGAAIAADVERAKAAYDRSRSENSQTKVSIIRALDKLAVISNSRPHALRKLNPIPKWMFPKHSHQHHSNNPLLIAARLKVKALKYNYQQAISGHLPSLHGQASWSKSHYGGKSPALLKNSKQRMAGVTIDIPLFSGGRINAQTQQARSLVQEAQNQYTLIQRQLSRSIHSYPTILLANLESINAAKQAIKSSTMDVSTLRANYRLGNARMSELLDAIKRLNTNKQLHAKTRYIYLKDYLNYLSLQGQLTPKKLSKINQLFLQDIILPSNI